MPIGNPTSAFRFPFCRKTPSPALVGNSIQAFWLYFCCEDLKPKTHQIETRSSPWKLATAAAGFLFLPLVLISRLETRFSMFPLPQKRTQRPGNLHYTYSGFFLRGRFFLSLEVHGHAVHAVPQACRPRAVGENVAEMAVAARTAHLSLQASAEQKVTTTKNRQNKTKQKTGKTKSNKITLILILNKTTLMLILNYDSEPHHAFVSTEHIVRGV